MAALPGMSQAVTVGATVTLDGSTSQAVSYRWALTGLPRDSRTVLVTDTSPVTSFVADVPGVYVVTLLTDVGLPNSLGVVATLP